MPDQSTQHALVDAIMTVLAGHDLLTLADIRNALTREIDDAGSDALLSLKDRLKADNGWEYYPADPLALRIHHLLADRLLRNDSVLVGIEHVEAVAGRPVAIFANHLSYADANLFEILLRRAGGEAVARRLTAIAGPKVFSSRERRFSSLCFGTVKVPQSADVSTEEAVLGAREVAQAARQAIGVARDRLRGGDALLIFGEGTRSRTLGMQRFLPGVARYLDGCAACVLPVGITGTEKLFPIGEEIVHPARVSVSVGPPMEADTLARCAGGDRRLMMDAIGLAVADALPADYRGAYANAEEFTEAASVLQRSRTGT